MSFEDGFDGKKTERYLEKINLPDSIVVTSVSSIKVEAVKKALRELFPKRNFNVIGVKAASGINEQPIGEETTLGALNRISDAEKIAPPTGEKRAFISIENGIFPDGKDGWEDKAVAVIKFPDGRAVSEISSRGVQFPKEVVEAARTKKGGLKDHTVGSVLAEMYAAKGIPMDKQDPHTTLTGGAFTREEQLMEAIHAALVKAGE